MFEINETIVYARSGLCKIEKIESKAFSVKNRPEHKCYVLKPIYDSSSTIYVPVENERLTSMMRNVLTKNEIDSLLEEIKGKENEWLDDQRERSREFRETLSNGIRTELLMMIRCIVQHKRNLSEVGKRLSSSDEAVLKEAKKEIIQEFAYALGIEQEGVEDYILSKVGWNKIIY